MKYLKPTYEKEKLDLLDFLMASSDGKTDDLGKDITLTEVDSTSARVGASILDILGLR